MEIINNIDFYVKTIVGVIGAIATFGKLRESFASIKRKQELKLDLEILEKIQGNDRLKNIDIENKIKDKLDKAFEPDNENLTNFFTGIAVFVGFGFWSMDIYRKSVNFNGLIILTIFLSLVGLTMIFSKSETQKKKGLFLQIGFYDRDNFIFGFFTTLLTGILTPILIIKIDGFSFWQFLSGLFFIIGLFSIILNIKRIK